MAQDTEVFLSDLSQRDKPWESHRAKAATVQGLYGQSQEPEFQRYAERVQNCSRLLEMILRTGDDGTQHFKLSTARFCRVRLCPVCQWRRSLMWRSRFLKALPSIITAYPSHRYIFITLTVKNCPLPELAKTIAMMNQGFGRLTKRKAWPGVGWVKSVEVTRNAKTDEAHPHFHVLVMVRAGYFKSGNYLRQDKWRELWKSVLKLDYLPVVNVKAVKTNLQLGKDNLIVALLETLKYGVKESDLIADAEWLQELTSQLHKTRAVSVGGVFKDFLKEDEPEDLINVDDLPDGQETGDPSFYFGWREAIQRYQLRGDL